MNGYIPTMKKRLTSEQKEELIRLYQNGMPPKDIGEKFNIRNNSVTRILRQKGIERNQSAKRVTESQTRIIIAQYTSGVSSEVIAAKMELNGSTICRVLKRNGIEIRPASKNKNMDNPWVENIQEKILKAIEIKSEIHEINKPVKIIPKKTPKSIKNPVITTVVRKLISKENKLKICTLYQEGLGSDTISKQFDIHPNTVLKILKKNGIKTRDWKRKISLEEHEKICKLYLKGQSTPEITKKYNVSDSVILKILTKYNIERRSAEETHRIYPIQEDFFDKIDTEEKAYVLGFFYADGCNSSNEKTITIDLNIKDKDILIKFADLIYLDGKPESHVHVYDRRNEGKGISGVLNVHSKYISKRISELGAPQRKTFKIEFPEWLDKKLIRHFIRGYFDGDGGTTVSGSMYSCNITGNYQFSTKIKQIIINETGMVFSEDKSKHNVITITTNGNRHAYQFLSWLYKDSKIKMNRKFNIYNNLKKHLQNTNEKTKAGTRGYPKIYLKKYSELLDVPYDETNTPGTPNLYNYHEKQAIIGPDNTPLTAQYIWNTQGYKRNKLVEFVFNHYREQGMFPHSKESNNTLIKEFKILQNINTEEIKDYINNQTSIAGTLITKHFCTKKFYNSNYLNSKSCVDAFNNDDLLLKAIKNRMGYNLEKKIHPYVYTMSDKTLIRGLISGGFAQNVSNFKPKIAKNIYNQFCPPNGTVLDYSAGWGGRLLGAMSLNLTYHGIDPSTSSELNEMSSFFNYDKATIINGCSENSTLFKQLNTTYDLIFSSPPYFNLEQYSNDDSQSYIKYSGYSDWLKLYWDKTVQNCVSVMKPKGKFLLCTSSNLGNDMLSISKQYLKLEKIIAIHSHSNHFSKSKNTKVNEYIYVLSH